MPMQRDKAAINASFDRLLKTQEAIAEKKNNAMVGGVYGVLVEGRSKTNQDTLTGRTDNGKLVHFTGGDEHIGQIVPIKIESAGAWNLVGKLI
jgi:tRNA-2-methylthio-N6-dimethylallyladenosine synthase